MSGLADFTKLLATCARNKVPDYYRFYSAVQKMFDGAVPPRTFCECFGAELRHADNALKFYSQRSERGEPLSQEEILEAKLAFHKLKLLSGCLTRLPKPMSDLITTLAGC